jgi:TatD DNase family protein
VIDFHCHLDLYQSPLAVADESQRRGFGVLSVTTTPSAWNGTARLAEGRSAIRTAIGLHPQLARQRKHELPLFNRCLESTPFVGEVGLDGSPEFKPFWEDQLEVFNHVLQACSAGDEKVVSIHSRRAANDVLDQLDRFDQIKNPVLHWFSGSPLQLERAIARRCWFSVGPAMLTGAKGG